MEVALRPATRVRGGVIPRARPIGYNRRVPVFAAADLSLLSRLYDEVAALADAEARVRWLARLPPEQQHLRAALEAMLHAQTGPDALSATPGATTGATAGAATAPPSAPRPARLLAAGPRVAAGAGRVAASAGDIVGPWRLERELGRGGMGSVWLARRLAGGLDRAVALKLPRLAWDDHLAERMARERRIATRLEHPNIARLDDAGVDDAGRPWLAFAFIDGEPIDRWCRRHAAPVAARLALFVEVARAVAHAHGRLVVHRDLKPSNVLVDVSGRAHLLDFGVAKLMEEAAEDDGLTREHGRMLTPRYAAPEQRRGEPATVAADIWSLGLLLHELLTGREPPPAAEEPLPPSRCAPDAATRRALAGDLDAIVGKALEPDPARRYATADALAEDVARHLLGEPVQARPPTLAYRLAKGVRKHRVAVGAGVAVVVALASGLAVALVQAERAREALARAEVVKAFVIDVFRVNQRGSTGLGAGGAAAGGQGANAELRRLPAELLLERGAALIEARFAGQPALQAELFGVVAGIFADMGANDLAARYAALQVEALGRLGAGDAEFARAHLLHGQTLLGLGRLAEAAAAASAAHERAPKGDGTGTPAGPLRAQALVLEATVQRVAGRLDEARALLARAAAELPEGAPPSTAGAQRRFLEARLADATRFRTDAQPKYLAAIDEALAAEGPASATAVEVRLAYAGRLVAFAQPEEAQAQRAAALAALREGGTAGVIRAALVESELAVASHMMGALPFPDAVATIERSRGALEGAGPLVPESVRARVALDLGSVHAQWGDVARSRELLEGAAATLAPRLEAARERMLLAAYRGMAAFWAGRHDEAAPLLAERIVIRRGTGDGNHPYAAFDTAWVALNHAHAGRAAEARALLQGVLAADAPPAPPGLPLTARQVHAHALARVLLLEGQPALAARWLPEAFTGFRQLPWDAKLLAAEIGCAQGRAGAIGELEAAIAEQRGFVHPHHPELMRARAAAGSCALAIGDRRAAARWLAEAEAGAAAQPQAGAGFRRPLAALRQAMGGVPPVAAAPKAAP
jgi:serine/threonine-protein kinase